MHFDPTHSVDLKDPHAVFLAIDSLLLRRFGPGYGQPLLEQAICDLACAFRGEYPGLLRCDTLYHDLRHALDCALAMARLLDGQATCASREAPEFIDMEHALLGILLALYHDIGMLRRCDEAHMQGAQLTPIHEARGVEFMRDYLGCTALAHLAQKAELIMVTRLTWHMPADISRLDRAISCLLGAADIMSQLADRCYLEKCRDFLFVEFSAIGLAGSPGLPYPDPETLLKTTPEFYTGLLRERIHNEYADADRHMEIHFGGICPYAAAIKRNFDYLGDLLANEDLSRLQRLPQRVI
ncbi:MAG: HD domain-containing protein [Sterolibacterium sp.]|nr:HD domain-containing protein [Sterolibacterium sp.]